MTSLKSVVESLLFVADTPLTLDRLCSILEEHDRRDISAAVDELLAEYVEGTRGIYLAEVAGGWQLRSRPENADYLRRLNRSRPYRFSNSSLETLAIVAYRQPITRAGIEAIRGVNSDGAVATLLARDLIEETGRARTPGRPALLGTTVRFLEHFGLEKPSDLPPLPTEEEPDEVRLR